MQNNFLTRIKRGESLVEVIVALSIITVALGSVIQLIIYSSNLNLSSRDRTRAIAEIQKAENDFVSTYILSQCKPESMDDLNLKNKDAKDNCTNGTSLTAPGVICTYTTVSVLTGSEIDISLGMDLNNFMKVTTVGRWKGKDNVIQEFSISQIIRKRL